MMKIPKLRLSDGREIPQVGLGLWQVKDKALFNDAVDAAIAAGYTHFDTAQAYGNEQYLGEAFKRLDVRRGKMWVTTKIAVQHFGYNHVHRSFEESLKNLQMDYVDLLLLHFPVSVLRKKSWLALEEIKAAGKAKSIGVSNFTIRHLEAMKAYAREMPVVNQVELHLFLQQPELLAYCKRHNIAVEAYSPLAHARAMDDQTINDLAGKYRRSYAQIMLRWCLQKGLIVLPKSVTPSRIQENIALFDFELSDNDVKRLESLERNLRTCWDPTHVP